MSAEMTETMPHPMGTYPWWLLLLQGIIALILGAYLLAYPLPLSRPGTGRAGGLHGEMPAIIR